MEAAPETISARRNRHPTEDEYAAWFGYSQQAAARNLRIYRSRCFVQTYPDLAGWFQARCMNGRGLIQNERERLSSARARQYLYFLAIKGSSFDSDRFLPWVGTCWERRTKREYEGDFRSGIRTGRMIGYSRSTKNGLGRCSTTSTCGIRIEFLVRRRRDRGV